MEYPPRRHVKVFSNRTFYLIAWGAREIVRISFFTQLLVYSSHARYSCTFIRTESVPSAGIHTLVNHLICISPGLLCMHAETILSETTVLKKLGLSDSIGSKNGQIEQILKEDNSGLKLQVLPSMLLSMSLFQQCMTMVKGSSFLTWISNEAKCGR